MPMNSKAQARIWGCIVLLSPSILALPGCRSDRSPPPGSDAGTLVLTGGTLLDPDSAPRAGTIVIRDGRLACVGSADECPPPAAAQSVDLRGLFIGPGLIDAHVHFGQTGWVDGRPD